eukprot:3096669-Pyramimonas_sp.AAC.1
MRRLGGLVLAAWGLVGVSGVLFWRGAGNSNWIALSWAPLKPSGRLLGPFWVPLGPAWDPLGPSWRPLGGLLDRVGAILGTLE